MTTLLPEPGPPEVLSRNLPLFRIPGAWDPWNVSAVLDGVKKLNILLVLHAD
jgi:hypothetical protein